MHRFPEVPCKVEKYIYLVSCIVQMAEERRYLKPPYRFFMDSQTAPERRGSASLINITKTPGKDANTSFRLPMVLKDAEV